MKSKIISCYNYKQVEVPEELTRWHIPDSEIKEELEALARDHSGEEEIESEIREGDSVRCVCTNSSQDTWKERIILLYPGRKLPGAEEAEQMILGKRKGEELACRLGSTEVSLRVETVIRRNVMEPGDELTARLGLPGVSTVEDYYRWYHGQKDEGRRQEACNAIVREWLTAIAANSEFEIDEEERREWCDERARVLYRGMLAAGHDPRKQEDGTVVTEEEAVREMSKEQERYFIPYIIYCYFCENNGFAVTEEDYRTAVKNLAKEQGLTEEDAFERSDIIYYRQVTYQEHTFLRILGPEARKYLED